MSEECRSRLDIVAQHIQFQKASDSVRDTVRSAKEKFIEVNWGRVPDATTAAAKSMSSQVASDIANGLVDGYESTANAALKTVLRPLLFLVMAYPNSVHSLIRIPQDAAIKAATREKMLLLSAQSKINTISEILKKWLSPPIQANYRKMIEESRLFTNRAIRYLEKVVYELEGERQRFDTVSLQNARINLDRAIESSKAKINHPVVETVKLERKKLEQETRAKDIQEAKLEHKQRVLDIKTEYKNKVVKIKNKDRSLSRSVDLSKHKLWYQQKMNSEKDRYKLKLNAIDLGAKARSMVDPSVYKNTGATTVDKLWVDLELVKDLSGEFYKDMTKALVFHKLSQLRTISVYSYRSMISRMIYYIVDLLRQSAAPVANVTASAIQNVIDDLEEVGGRLSSAIDAPADTPNSATLSKSELASALSEANSRLLVAKTKLGSATTQSAIDTINSAASLEDSGELISELIEAIAAIPDWNNELGVWGVSGSAAPSPYQHIMKNSPVLTTMLGGAMLSGDGDKTLSVTSNIHKLTSSLIYHNTLTLNALNRYRPDMHPVAKEFESALKSINALGAFSNGFAIKVVVENLKDSAISEVLGDLSQIKKCKKALGESELSEADIERFRSDTALSSPDKSAVDPDEVSRIHNQHIDYLSHLIEADEVIGKLPTDPGLVSLEDIEALYDSGDTPML